MDEKQSRAPDQAGPGNARDEPPLEFSITQSDALIPLLVISVLTVVVIFFLIVTAKPVVSPEGAIANTAFSPADFPDLFAPDEVIERIAGEKEQLRGEFPGPAPPFTEGIFPCMQCHEMIPPNPERRPLEGMHGDIVFEHDAEHRWCLDCHDEENRDQLRLASGVHVPFTESYRLCGQCHGARFREWRAGIHGKRTGRWDGAKQYLLCVHCHNPHSPAFAPVAPLPPPVRPQFLRPEDAVAYDEAGRHERAAVLKEIQDDAQAH
jgi:hypothetical protein